MKIPLKAKVICKDGEYGSLKELLIDPLKEKVTHVVVQNKHNGNQIIISTNIIDYTSDTVVTIEKTANELNDFPKFIVHEFVKVPTGDSQYAFWGADPTMLHSYTMFPYVMHEGNPVVEVTKEVVDDDEQRLRKGLKVKDVNGKNLGHIDELVVNKKNDFITHIVMRTGHIFGTREVVVPNINIRSFKEDSIILNIGEDQVADLPEVALKRTWE